MTSYNLVVLNMVLRNRAAAEERDFIPVLSEGVPASYLVEMYKKELTDFKEDNGPHFLRTYQVLAYKAEKEVEVAVSSQVDRRWNALKAMLDDPANFPFLAALVKVERLIRIVDESDSAAFTAYKDKTSSLSPHYYRASPPILRKLMDQRISSKPAEAEIQRSMVDTFKNFAEKSTIICSVLSQADALVANSPEVNFTVIDRWEHFMDWTSQAEALLIAAEATDYALKNMTANLEMDKIIRRGKDKVSFDLRMKLLEANRYKENRHSNLLSLLAYATSEDLSDDMRRRLLEFL